MFNDAEPKLYTATYKYCCKSKRPGKRIHEFIRVLNSIYQGWAINLARGRRPRIAEAGPSVMETEASLGSVSLSTNVYYDQWKSISNLKIFLNASADR